MKHFFVQATIVLSTLNLAFFSLGARADITSTEAGQNSFIKITQLADTQLIRFEECSVQSPTQCKQIGTRDYSVSELQSLHDELLKQADSDKSWNFLNVLEVLGGVVGGAAVGCATGAVIGGVAGAGIFLGSVAYGLAGCGLGVVVGGIGGGVGVYYWVKSTKANEVKQLDGEAQAIEEIAVDDQPVQISTDIDSFVKNLSTLLGQIPNAPTLP